jgi:hypothetical protein
VVQNITEGAKVKLKQVSMTVEPDLLYPLLRGRDVQRWHAQPSAWIIVPQDPNRPSRAYPEASLQVDYPKTYAYLKRFKKELRNRSGYKQILSRREKEFYGLMDIDDYTFEPWKVVWTRIGSIQAAVVGSKDEKIVIPQETITLVPCTSHEEAHYICAIVNSAVFQFAAESYSQKGGKSMGTMHLLDHIRIPCYDPNNAVHRRLAELSMQAHQLMGGAPSQSGGLQVMQPGIAQLEAIEAEIDQLAAQIWGLTEQELAAIRQSLSQEVDDDTADSGEGLYD